MNGNWAGAIFGDCRSLPDQEKTTRQLPSFWQVDLVLAVAGSVAMAALVVTGDVQGGMLVRSAVAALVGGRFMNPPSSDAYRTADNNGRYARSDLDVDPACHVRNCVMLTERGAEGYSPNVDLRRRMWW